MSACFFSSFKPAQDPSCWMFNRNDIVVWWFEQVVTSLSLSSLLRAYIFSNRCLHLSCKLTCKENHKLICKKWLLKMAENCNWLWGFLHEDNNTEREGNIEKRQAIHTTSPKHVALGFWFHVVSMLTVLLLQSQVNSCVFQFSINNWKHMSRELGLGAQRFKCFLPCDPGLVIAPQIAEQLCGCFEFPQQKHLSIAQAINSFPL